MISSHIQAIMKVEKKILMWCQTDPVVLWTLGPVWWNTTQSTMSELKR